MTPRPVRFLSADDVFRVHRFAMLDQGVEPRLRDPGLLDSALAMPRQQFGGEYLHPDIPSMAAAYAFHIAANHPFEDGNKRAATAAMIQFLSDNGWSFDATADEAEPAILKLAAGQLTKEELTRWVAGVCHEKPSLELREFFMRVSNSEFVSSWKAGQANSKAEIGATADEARQAIPLVDTLIFSGDMHGQQGDADAQRVCYSQALLLCILYRLAEDMGYEW